MTGRHCRDNNRYDYEGEDMDSDRKTEKRTRDNDVKPERQGKGSRQSIEPIHDNPILDEKKYGKSTYERIQ